MQKKNGSSNKSLIEKKEREEYEQWKKETRKFLEDRHKEFLDKVKGCTVYQTIIAYYKKTEPLAVFSDDGKELDVFNKPKMYFSHCLAHSYGIYEVKNTSQELYMGFFLAKDIVIMYSTTERYSVFGGEGHRIYLRLNK